MTMRYTVYNHGQYSMSAVHKRGFCITKQYEIKGNFRAQCNICGFEFELNFSFWICQKKKRPICLYIAVLKNVFTSQLDLKTFSVMKTHLCNHRSSNWSANKWVNYPCKAIWTSMFLLPTIAGRTIKLSFIPCYYSNYETDNSFPRSEVIIFKSLGHYAVSWAWKCFCSCAGYQ